MLTAWTAGAALYIAGVVVGLLTIDARVPARIGLAMLWPLGPLAFVITISTLVVASAIAFPVVGGAILVAAGIAWWAMKAIS